MLKLFYTYRIYDTMYPYMQSIAEIFGGKVYCCDMTDIEKNRYFSKYRDLKELYKAYFGRGEINDGENL